MNVHDAVNLFLDSRKRGTGGAKRKCRPSTLEIYSRNMEIFSKYLLEQHTIIKYNEIRRLHIVQFLDWIDEKVSSGTWSKSTMLQMLRVLRTFFHWVEKDEDCQDFEMRPWHKYLPVVEKTPQRTDIPDTSQLKAFLQSFNTARRWDYRDYIAVCIMLETGIRVGEVCNLRVDHVNLDDLLMVVDGKTGPRVVPISSGLAKLLKAWLKKRANYRTAQDSDLVFISKDKGSMDKDAFGKRFRKRCQRFGFKRITAHSLRHAFCTHYLEKGGDIEKLRSITGHSTYTMLQGYLHVAKMKKESLRKELEQVSMLKEL